MNCALATRNQLRPEYSASDKAVYLMRNGTTLADLYAESAALHQDPLTMAKADILQKTYQPQNIYHSEDQVNYETGELFEGYSVLVNGLCSRVSPAYLSASARRARKYVRGKIAEAKPLVGQQWRFMTLTLPYLRTDVQTVMKILDRAVTNFKKNKSLWIPNVSGAFLAEEMTIGEESRQVNTHFHIHIHILMLGKWVDQSEWADLWTKQVENACKFYNVECPVTNLKTNRLIVDIRDVRAYARNASTTFDKSIEELCKYTTKGSEYKKVPVREIVEIDNALRNRKMIKTYGCFNSQKGKGKSDTGTKDTSLDTKCTTDALSQKRLLNNVIGKTVKRESLAMMGAKLISEGKQDIWRSVLDVVFENRREFRAEQLMRKYPYATFRTLSGDRWFGVSKRPPKSNVVALVDYWQKPREKPDSTNLLDEIVEDYDNGNLLDEIVVEYEKQSWLVSVGIVDKKRRAETRNKPSLQDVFDVTKQRHYGTPSLVH